jgi:hypothetical protein
MGFKVPSPGDELCEGGELLGMLHVAEVDVGGEELRVGAPEDDHPDVAILPDLGHEAREVADERRVQEVDRRMVDRHIGDAVVHANAQRVEGVVHGWAPFSRRRRWRGGRARARGAGDGLRWRAPARSASCRVSASARSVDRSAGIAMSMRTRTYEGPGTFII